VSRVLCARRRIRLIRVEVTIAENRYLRLGSVSAVDSRPVDRFQGLGGKIFYFIICLKQIFLGITKFGGFSPVATDLVDAEVLVQHRLVCAGTHPQVALASRRFIFVSVLPKQGQVLSTLWQLARLNRAFDFLWQERRARR